MLAAFRRKDHSVSTYFAALVIFALVPVLATYAWIENRAASAEQARIELDAAQKAHEIAERIDRKIVARENLLTVLAGSHSLLSGDLKAFYDQAEALSHQLDITVVLRDPATGRELVNSSIPWGVPLGLGTARLDGDRAQALRSGKPAISDVFFANNARRYSVAVTLPVLHNGILTYFLSEGLGTDEFAALLGRSRIAPAQIATIVDSAGVIVARSQRNREFAGKQVVSGELKRDGAALDDHAPGSHEWPAEGVAKGANLEGIPFQYFFTRSATTGWRVTVGVPQTALDAPWRRAVVNILLTGGLLLILGAAIAYAIGRRISRSISALQTAVVALGQHEQVVPPHTDLRETNAMANVLSAASTELRASDRQLSLAIEAAELGTWSWNTVTDEFSASDRTKEIFGVPLSINGDRSTFFSRVHPFDHNLVEEGMQRCLTGVGHFDLEYRIVDSSERAIRWISSKGRAEVDDVGKALRVRGIVQDITARKQIEKERDELRLRLMHAQEQERLRLAHELHDQTGQSLAAVMLELKAVEAQIQEGGRDRLRRLRRYLDQMGKTLHRVAWELRPTSIDELGLAAALTNYISEWSTHCGVEVDFHCADGSLDQLPEEVCTTVYRVVQEALTNVLKHAGNATAVSITSSRTQTMLRLTIEDNGSGFDPSTLGTGGRFSGLGLAGMRERLSLIEGELEVESSAGAGTTLFIRMRLPDGRMTA